MAKILFWYGTHLARVLARPCARQPSCVRRALVRHRTTEWGLSPRRLSEPPIDFGTDSGRKRSQRHGLRYSPCSLSCPLSRTLSSTPRGGVAAPRGARRTLAPPGPRRQRLTRRSPFVGPRLINASVGGLRVAVDMGVPRRPHCTLRVRDCAQLPHYSTCEGRVVSGLPGMIVPAFQF